MNYKIKAILLLAILAFVCNTAQAQENGFITNGKTIIHYKKYGKGKPVLIINGGPGLNCDGFGYVASKMADMGYMAIIYDQRGTGQSTVDSVNERSINMTAMVDDLEVLRQHLGLSEWTILGHSFGGLLATKYAYDHPDRVTKLIFSSSGGINLGFRQYISTTLNNNLGKTDADSLAYYEKLADNGDTTLLTLRNHARVLAKAYVFNKEKTAGLIDRFLQTNYEINALVFKDLEASSFDYTGKFKEFRKPVLVLQGKNDIIKTETAQQIAAAFSQSRLVLLDKCGHYGWLDAPEVYWKSIKKFLAGKR